MNTTDIAAERLSRFTYVLAFTLAALHIFNFLNYSTLVDVLPLPMIRLVISVLMAVILLFANFNKLFSYHLRYNYDVYLFCLLAIVSIGFSPMPGHTLIYSFWLLISTYMALELAERVRNREHMQKILAAVIVPSVAFAAIINVTFGAAVQHTGRVFGALGTRHVDTAFAMDMILLMLAFQVLGKDRWRPTRLLRFILWGLLALAVYQAVFGLTRSVWLAVVVALLLYTFAGRLTAPRIVLIVLGTIALAGVGMIFSLEALAPDVVRERIELTRQRAEAGEIDPRVAAIKGAFEVIAENPLGLGFANPVRAHNSYLNAALDLGVGGILLMIVIGWRSFVLIRGAGGGYAMFFAIGSGGLLIHAFFETQNTPGQGNFYPLLIWFAMTRSTFILGSARDRTGRRSFRPGSVSSESARTT